MKRSLAILMVSLGILPPQALAQPSNGLAVPEHPLPGVFTASAQEFPGMASAGAFVRSGAIRDAINREAARLNQSSTPASTGSGASRSWAARHPVLLGTLVGTGVGVAIDSGMCGWGGGGCGFWLGGMGAGAFGGLLVSARPKPAFTAGPPSSPRDVSPATPSSNRPDVLPVARVVESLGVGEQIVVTDFNGRQVRGSIQSIGPDRVVVVPDRQPTPVEIAFSEIRDVRKRPLGTGARIGIAAGVIGVVLTVLAVVSCNSPNGMCQ